MPVLDSLLPEHDGGNILMSMDDDGGTEAASVEIPDDGGPVLKKPRVE
jgi:hypothetical protein